MLKGTIISGLGKAKHYLNHSTYQELIKKHLDIEPFPGTLNVKTDPDLKQMFLNSLKLVQIHPLSENKANLSSISCYKAKLNNIQGAIIIPDKTSHSNNIVEFIAHFNLREHLNLADNDEVCLEAP